MRDIDTVDGPIEVVDSPIGAASDILLKIVDAVTGNIMSQAKTALTELIKEKTNQPIKTITTFFKWYVTNKHDEKDIRKHDLFLYTKKAFIDIIKPAFKKRFADDQQEKFNEKFNNLWAKNEQKILKIIKNGMWELLLTSAFKKEISNLNKILAKKTSERDYETEVKTFYPRIKEILLILDTNETGKKLVAQYNKIKKMEERKHNSVDPIWRKELDLQKLELRIKLIKIIKEVPNFIATNGLITTTELLQKDPEYNWIESNLKNSNIDEIIEEVTPQIKEAKSILHLEHSPEPNDIKELLKQVKELKEQIIELYKVREEAKELSVPSTSESSGCEEEFIDDEYEENLIPLPRAVETYSREEAAKALDESFDRGTREEQEALKLKELREQESQAQYLSQRGHIFG